MERLSDLNGPFLSAPLRYTLTGQPRRTLEGQLEMLDNLIELIVFTPRGSFTADPDFGFEYWNYEFTNVHFRDFNNGQSGRRPEGNALEITKKACLDSLVNSLAVYAPCLMKVEVGMELNPAPGAGRYRKAYSKYEIVVTVRGKLDSGLDTVVDYMKDVRFLVEPVAKKIQI